MWSPTHVQVTVKRAKDLIAKGKNGTNDTYVLIQLGQEKFQTSIKEHTAAPEWQEECDLSLPEDEGASIVLTVFHRNFLNIDEFLGQVQVPLAECNFYAHPRNRWYPLKSKSKKSEKKEDKNRGSIEVCLSFVVRSDSTDENLLAMQSQKKAYTGSLKDIALNFGHKLQKIPSRSLSMRFDQLTSNTNLNRFRRRNSTISSENKDYDDDDDNGFPSEANDDHLIENIRPLPRTSSIPGLCMHQSTRQLSMPADQWSDVFHTQNKDCHIRAKSEDDLSEQEEDDRFENASVEKAPKERKGLSLLRLGARRHTIQSGMSDLLKSLTPHKSSSQDLSEKGSHDTPEKDKSYSNLEESAMLNNMPKDIVQKYEKLNYKELLAVVVNQYLHLERQDDKIRDLEDYIDDLLVRVMETTPFILQKAYRPKGTIYQRYTR